MRMKHIDILNHMINILLIQNNYYEIYLSLSENQEIKKLQK